MNIKKHVHGIRPNELRFLRPKDVAQVLGISRQQLWRMRQSGLFFNPVKISASAVGFRSDQLLEWMNNRESVDVEKEKAEQPHPTFS